MSGTLLNTTQKNGLTIAKEMTMTLKEKMILQDIEFDALPDHDTLMQLVSRGYVTKIEWPDWPPQFKLTESGKRAIYG